MLYPKDPAVKIERTADSVSFSWRRSALEGWAAFILASLLTIVSFLPVSSQSPYGSDEKPGPSLGLVGFFALFTLPLVYFGLCAILNSTTIRADRGRVARFSGPVWAGKGIGFAAQGIQQFFAIGAVASRNLTGYSFGTVYLIDAEGHVRALASSLPSSFAANQVCHELEDFYGIEDMPVYGVTTDPSHPGPRGLHP